MPDGSANQHKRGNKRPTFVLSVAEQGPSQHKHENTWIEFNLSIAEQSGRIPIRPSLQSEKLVQKLPKIHKKSSSSLSRESKRQKKNNESFLQDKSSTEEAPEFQLSTEFDEPSLGMEMGEDNASLFLIHGNESLDVSYTEWEDEKKLYWECCMAENGLIRLDCSTFIVQDWDQKLKMLKGNKFFHVRYLPLSETKGSLVCDCKTNNCRHTDILSEHLDFVLSAEPECSEQYPPAYLVSQHNGKEHYISSVRGSSGEGQTGGKQVMIFLMRDSTWRCTSCTSKGHSHHKQPAQEYAQGARITDGDNINLDSPTEPSPDQEEAGQDVLVDPVQAERPISYLPIPVPKWARLPTDLVEYLIHPLDTPALHYSLDQMAHCHCGNVIPNGTNAISVPIVTETFLIFGLHQVYNATIELARCIICNHRMRLYGPDLGTHGIFNWNNSFGFTHELLN
ncbi:hypothetical protein M422DRAFT_275025 [Sphaerobolus stellatus SS14]|uniref:HMG domain-containing protein n=1 Tax=Sphaerobolus stellatus (strain SS14) TaxID=990650 RepID=A0A0C9TQL0_SPHS4|nr:hypothetical protein M422DRAFT_275025 [Sphaerobolus stellatus SS14]